MYCESCGHEVSGEAKFCPECGTKMENAKRQCPQCQAVLRPSAKFCHQCGMAVEAEAPEPREKNKSQNVFSTLGLVLFIPIFAIGIITLLFWKNKDPVPLQASNAASSEQGVPSMAAMGDVHKTLERLKQNVEENPNDVVSLDSLAIMYSIAGSYDKARQYYERHLQIEPDNKDVKIALALTYSNLKRTEEAISLLQDVLNEEPDYAFALYYLGDIYARGGQIEAAERTWKRVVEKYPNTEIAQSAQQRIHELTHADSGSD